MRKLLFFLMMLCCSFISAQLTKWPSVNKEGGRSRMPSINWTLITKDGTLYVSFCYPLSYVDSKIMNEGLRLQGTKDMVCRYRNPRNYTLIEVKGTGKVQGMEIPNYVQRYNDEYKDVWYTRIFVFPPIVDGVTNISLRDNLTGEYWDGIHIKNELSPANIDEMEQILNNAIAQSESVYAGKYEAIETEEAFAFVQENENNYKLVNIGEVMPIMKVASLKATAYPNVFIGTYYSVVDQENERITLVFDNGIMTIKVGNVELDYIRMNDGSTSFSTNTNVSKWSGTGFALKNGYVVTNYHVAGEAKTIEIYGVNGNASKGYKATVVGADKVSDLALLKITDKDFSGYGNPPYAFKSSMVDVGENVYVLGYPLTQTMGEEIKLTNGIISARSGYEGDVTTYQISVPVQPGNSGGPMFDMKGNLVGIVCAKHAEAENANYAIKTSYLKNLVESVASSSIFPTVSTINGKELKEQVKQTRNFVYMIKCSDISDESSSSSDSYTPSGNPDNYPIVRSSLSKSTKIKSVSLERDYTAVTLECSSTEENWCNIDKNTYIMVKGIEYTMTKAEGIKYAPERTIFSKKITFTLYFPPIPTSATSMDLIESEYSEWQFFDIKIR